MSVFVFFGSIVALLHGQAIEIPMELLDPEQQEVLA